MLVLVSYPFSKKDAGSCLLFPFLSEALNARGVVVQCHVNWLRIIFRNGRTTSTISAVLTRSIAVLQLQLHINQIYYGYSYQIE